MISLICRILNDTDELIYKADTDSQTYRKNLWFPRREGWGKGIVREFGIDTCTLLYLK